jgi:hypothetical protein
MTNESGRKLVDDYLTIEADRQKIRLAYLPKSGMRYRRSRSARFYQLEIKIQATGNYELAAGIPLIY